MADSHASDLDGALDRLRSLYHEQNWNALVAEGKTHRKTYPENLEIAALYLRGLKPTTHSSPAFPALLEELDEMTGDDMTRKLQLAEHMIEYGLPKDAEALLSFPYEQMQIRGVTDEEAFHSCAIMLAEAMAAAGLRSSALDVLDETQALIPHPSVPALRARIEKELAPNDESVHDELHAVRRKVFMRYLSQHARSDFDGTEEMQSVLDALMVAWNVLMEDGPLPYGMMTKPQREKFLNRLYVEFDSALAKGHVSGPGGSMAPEMMGRSPDTGNAGMQDAEGELDEELLEEMREQLNGLMQVIPDLFDDETIEWDEALRPFMHLLPLIIMHIEMPYDDILQYSEGDKNEGIAGGLNDCGDILQHLIASLLAKDEDEKLEHLFIAYEIFRFYLHEDIANQVTRMVLRDVEVELDEFFAILKEESSRSGKGKSRKNPKKGKKKKRK